MNRRPISWILDFASKLPNDEEKIKCLRANNHKAILTILQFCYHPGVEWVIPSGEPPYTPAHDSYEGALYDAAKRLYLFVKGGNDNLDIVKREMLFVKMLEEVLPEDAKLLLSIKEKKLPYPGLNEKLVRVAFPDIF